VCLGLVVKNVGHPGAITAVSFDYGQAHSKELAYAGMLEGHYQVEHEIVKLDRVLLRGLAKESKPIKEPDLTQVNLLPKTWVPGRNLIMIAQAAALAYANQEHLIVGGWHASDYPGYPDCRVWFLECAERAVQEGMAYPVNLWAPLLHSTKRQIVKLGHEIDTPFRLTWSCYKGDSVPCGICDACVRRKDAFELNLLDDPALAK